MSTRSFSYYICSIHVCCCAWNMFYSVRCVFLPCGSTTDRTGYNLAALARYLHITKFARMYGVSLDAFVVDQAISGSACVKKNKVRLPIRLLAFFSDDDYLLQLLNSLPILPQFVLLIQILTSYYPTESEASNRLVSIVVTSDPKRPRRVCRDENWFIPLHFRLSSIMK